MWDITCRVTNHFLQKTCFDYTGSTCKSRLWIFMMGLIAWILAHLPWPGNLVYIILILLDHPRSKLGFATATSAWHLIIRDGDPGPSWFIPPNDGQKDQEFLVDLIWSNHFGHPYVYEQQDISWGVSLMTGSVLLNHVESQFVALAPRFIVLPNFIQLFFRQYQPMIIPTLPHYSPASPH